MYAQLGNIVFTGLYGFADLSFSGNEAALAELELINKKPTLQKVGDTLQEIFVTIIMRAEFCNPKQQIQALTSYKANGEVLPLLMGDGSYIGDFVIVSLPYSIDDAFKDGTIIQATVGLTLREFISNDKLEQKQLDAKQNALAVGDKKPVVIRNLQAPTLDKQASLDIAAVKQQNIRTDNLVFELAANPPAKPVNVEMLKNSLLKSKAALTELVDKIEKNVEYFAKQPSLKSAAILVLNSTNDFLSTYPFTEMPSVNAINKILQANNKNLDQVSTSLFQKIIIRR
ncbi:MAG: phage tail protein [Sphingobacteriaceae bacterium]|nr:phage tail protein [Sphingobacteriaceae bacterium]